MKSNLFLDEILYALNNPKGKFYQYVRSEHGDKQMRRTKHELINAQKISLSKDFIEQAVKSSFVRLPTFLNECQRAIPPFDNLWIEWNEKIRIDAIIKHSPYSKSDGFSGVIPKSDYVGYHIVRERLGYFAYTCWTKSGEILSALPVRYELNLERNFPQFYLKPTVSHSSARTSVLISALGRRYVFNSGAYTKQELANMDDHLMGKINTHFQLQDETNLALRLSLAASYAMTWMFSNKAKKRGFSQDQQNEINLMCIEATDGDIRFITTVFGLMNYDFHYCDIEKNEIIKSTAPRMKHPHPMFEYKVVKLDLPKLNGITVRPPLFTGHGTPKRQHWRRGHWRNQQGIRKWIEPQLVGDPKNGTLIHDYELVT